MIMFFNKRWFVILSAAVIMLFGSALPVLAERAWCWCQTQDLVCEAHEIRDSDPDEENKPIKTQQECNDYCSRVRGYTATNFDQGTYLDRTGKSSVKGQCPAKIQAATPTNPTGGSGQTGPSSPTTLYNPLAPSGGSVTIYTVISRVIRAITGIIGSIALLMFIWGGIIWMTSAGEPKKVSQAQNILKYAVYGLLIIFFSYAIVNIFLGAFQAPTVR